MKLMIAGSRSIQNFNLAPYIPAEAHSIICGGAYGIDRLAEEYADQHRLSKYIIRPLYSLYGRAAPIKRNRQMVDMADAILVVWDGVSTGTQYTIRYAKEANKPLTVIEIPSSSLLQKE